MPYQRPSLTVENPQGVEIVLPRKRVVCPRCRGYGHHDHPAFSNGISAQDFEEDPEFREDYLRGRFDVRCETCRGENVVDVPDRERMTPEQIAWLDAAEREDAAFEAEVANERRMGA